MERKLLSFTISPAQPFLILIAALHQHHKCYLPRHHHFTYTFSLHSHWAPKKNKKGLTHLQTNSHLHLFAFYSFLIFCHKRFINTDFFFPLHDGVCFFILHTQGILKRRWSIHELDSCPTRDLRALIYICIYKTPFSISHYYRVLPWSDSCFHDFLALYHDKFTFYLFVFFFYCHILLVPCFFFTFCS